MNASGPSGKKKLSGSENRKRIKENVQKNDLVIAKMPKLQNYFTTQSLVATRLTSMYYTSMYSPNYKLL